MLPFIVIWLKNGYCAYLIIQLSLEPDFCLVPIDSPAHSTPSSALIAILVKAENTGKMAWLFWTLSPPQLEWRIFVVFLGPYASENLCYVSIPQMAPK